MQKNKRWFRALRKIEKNLTYIVGWICTGWFSAMLLCMIWQVVSRFVLKISVPWTDEASRYFWVTLTFIGAGAAISDNAHVEINILASFLKKIKSRTRKMKLAQISDIVRYAILTCLGIFLAYNFLHFTSRVIELGQLSAALLIPMAIPYIIIDCGIISIILHSLLRLLISIIDHESIIDPQLIKGGEI